MDTQPQKNQSTFFRFPRLSEYAEAFGQMMRELKNIGASPGEIIGLLKGETDPPEATALPVEPVPPEAPKTLEEIAAGFEKLADDYEVLAGELETCLKNSIGAAYGKNFPYTAYKIASKLGIYSIYGRPHAHAVSAILNNNIRIGKEHMEERLLFSSEYFDVWYTRYDGYAMNCVADWIARNGLPYDIDGFYYTYHVRYCKN